MHLVDYSVGSILAFSGLTAGLGAAMLALPPVKERAIRVLFWASALSFGSSGIVWSATSEGYSLAVQMAVSAIVAAIAAAGLTWGLAELRGRTVADKEQTASPIVEKPAPDSQTNDSSFMKIGQGATVERLTVRGANVEGVRTGFDIYGKLKDANIQDFNSSSFGPNAAGRLKTMTIGRVSFAAPKIGIVQPSLPTNTSNTDGTVTSTMSFTIDEGVTTNLIIGIRGGGLIWYEIFKNGKLVATPWSRTDDGYILRRMDSAKGIYSAKIHRKNDIETLDVGIDTTSLNKGH